MPVNGNFLLHIKIIEFVWKLVNYSKIDFIWAKQMEMCYSTAFISQIIVLFIIKRFLFLIKNLYLPLEQN